LKELVENLFSLLHHWRFDFEGHRSCLVLDEDVIF
jgi:hypothetical protein